MMTIKTTLNGIPKTMLWTLHNRATEAMRSDGVIRDEKAISIYKNIDFDYEKYFGKPEPSHAIRSLDFDKEINKFVSCHPNGVIVNLGEGLETQRFRIKESTALWLSVDLPEAITIREQFIKADDRHLHIPLSATDRNWFSAIPKDKPVFITAQGLLMYFAEQEVKSLLQDISTNFNHAYIMFDTIPVWLSKKTISKQGWAKTKSYITPKMPWGINRNKIKKTLKSWLQTDAVVTDIGYSIFPRGATRWLFYLFTVTPILKNITPSIVKVTIKKTV